MPIMRIHTLFLLLISASILAAAPLPYEVSQLQAKRDAEVQKIDKLYVQALEQLKVKYTKAGNLAAANTVQEVIDEVNGVEPENDDAEDGSSLRDLLLSRTWLYSVPNGKTEAIELTSNGRAKISGTNERVWKSWKIEGSSILVVTYPSGGTCRFEFKDLNNPSFSGITEKGLLRTLKPLAKD